MPRMGEAYQQSPKRGGGSSAGTLGRVMCFSPSRASRENQVVAGLGFGVQLLSHIPLYYAIHSLTPQTSSDSLGQLLPS